MTATISVEMALPGDGLYSARFDVSTPGKRWKLLERQGRRIAGVHVYAHEAIDGCIRCDVRFSNAAVHRDGTGFCGKLYVTSLEVRTSAGLEIVTLPRDGEKATGGLYTVLVAPTAHATHVLLSRSQFERSLILSPPAKRRTALGILNRDAFVMPAVVEGFGPLNSRFPTIDRVANESQFRDRLAKVRDAVQYGKSLYLEDWADFQYGRMGYVQLDGSSQAGASAGFAIELSQADTQSRNALLFRETMARLGCEGRNAAIFDIDSGEPITAGQWSFPMHQQLVQRMNGDQHLECPCFLDGNYGAYHYRTFNPAYEGSCTYERQIDDIRAHDNAHLIRGLRHLIALYELTGDEMARDDLCMLFENARLDGWSNRPDDKEKLEGSDTYLFPSLREKLYNAHQHPHQATAPDRAYGWYMFSLAQMLKMIGPREDLVADGAALLDLYVTAADAFGVTLDGWLGASPDYFPDGISGTQRFHSEYIMAGALALSLQLNEWQSRSLNSALMNGCTTLNGTFADRVHGPKWVGMTFRDKQINPDGSVSWVNPKHVTALSQCYLSQEDPAPWAALHVGAILYRMTHDKKWLEMVRTYWLSATSLGNLKTKLDEQKYLGLAGEMQAVLEEVV